MSEPKALNLALQGGGSHGAFTWGVLDRILADDRLHVEAVSGTSAGAMNAVALAHGMATGGREGARKSLSDFWMAVSRAAAFSPFRRTPLDQWMGNWSLDRNPVYVAMDLLSRVVSPYFTLFEMNPLHQIVDKAIDFEKVRQCANLEVFISATNVETGGVKVFRREELTIKHVLASACLPYMHKAVVIDGVPYWDGGFMGNPVLYPFFRRCSSDDILVVQINPIERKGVPTDAREIMNRMNEITFNGSLLKEFRAIDFVARLLEDGLLDGNDYKHVYLHMIDDDQHMAALTASSKLNAERAFIEHLRDLGHAAADRWLERNFDQIGKASTFDVRAMYQRQ